ncbi:MAG: hypothetical protein AAGB46_02405 [Verrucomicrobiota bacterium]
MKLFLSATLATITFLFAACSKSDPHDAPRDNKAYESVDPSQLELPALIAHLNLLATETQAAVDAKAAVEFHHLEVALTPTLDAIQAKAGPKAATIKPSIDTLKALALKLHESGHDNNIGMASKISQKFSELIPQIETALK